MYERDVSFSLRFNSLGDVIQPTPSCPTHPPMSNANVLAASSVWQPPDQLTVGSSNERRMIPPLTTRKTRKTPSAAAAAILGASCGLWL
jgi:hypothetical protein